MVPVGLPDGSLGCMGWWSARSDRRRAGLALVLAGLQRAWVLDATSVALAGGLLVSGRVADVLGRRPVFLTSLAMLAVVVHRFDVRST